MHVERAVRRLGLRRRPAVNGHVVCRNDPGVLIDLPSLMIVVASEGVAELTDRSSSVEPALRRTVGANRTGEVDVILLRGAQGFEVDRPAERIAPLGVGGPEAFAHIDAVEGWNGEL